MRPFTYGRTLLVMNRAEAEEFFSHPENRAADCISITDPGSEPANLEFAAHVCRRSFHDVEDDDEQGLSHGLCPMSETDAFFIAAFASRVVDTLVIHCEGGVSRSAGIAAGILAMNPLSYDGDLYREKVPNATCKRLVMQAIANRDARNCGYTTVGIAG